MGIRHYGEKLQAGSFPQNTFTCVLAEQGLIGGMALLGFICIVVYSSWKYRNRDRLCKVFS
jgi:hypothetical protein